MKANYNRKPKNVREKAVTFRAKGTGGSVFAFCVIQNTLYERMPDDKDVVYLDFEDETQMDKLINTLQDMKKRAYQKVEENADESKAES